MMPCGRVLLTRLLLSAGQPVSVHQLCADLWEGRRCPPGVVSSVHSHISRLRTALELDRGRSTGSELLVCRSTGYVLAIDADDLDTHAFEAALLHARAAMAEDDLTTALRVLTAAMDLWRGPALHDAADYRFAEQETSRLLGIRQFAEETLARLLLDDGQVDAAIQITERLTKAAPLREESWEALRHYARLRAAIAEELGVDPGPALRELHLAILRHDQAALGPGRPSAVRSGRATGPAADAPAAPAARRARRVPGRENETARLLSVVAGAAKGPRWAVVSGETGSGKSALLSAATAYATANEFSVTRIDHRDTASGCAAEPIERLLAEVRETGGHPSLHVLHGLEESCSRCVSSLRKATSVLHDEPVAIGVSLRDPKAAGLVALMTDLAYADATQLRLDPLEVADVARLLSAQGEDGAPGTASALHRRSEGNLFVLRELLRLPPERRTGPGARVPLSVEALLLPHFMHLSEPVRSMLEGAAVDGDVLDVPLLAASRSLTPAGLLPLIDEAMRSGVLCWDSAEGVQGYYRFRGPMRDVVLATLTPAARQMPHAGLAEALQRLPLSRPASVARHLSQGGPGVTSEQLGAAQLRAGRESHREHRYEAAFDWYTKAVRTSGPTTDVHRDAGAHSAGSWRTRGRAGPGQPTGPGSSRFPTSPLMELPSAASSADPDIAGIRRRIRK